ncbi:hypothetical protein H0O00_03790, partial [Candidatus Micrarchaeota archaeon]|nr:hypothetical protein [Candidatus Micrarchaeota archaeon]
MEANGGGVQTLSRSSIIQKVLVSRSERAGYLAAWKLAADRGMELASISLYDRHLAEAGKSKKASAQHQDTVQAKGPTVKLHLGMAGYLEAWKLAADEMKAASKLPPGHLAEAEKSAQQPGMAPGKVTKIKSPSSGMVWVKGVLAYPEKGGVFVSGYDAVDSKTGWVLPARYIPKEAIGLPGIGLFIDPADISRLTDPKDAEKPDGEKRDNCRAVVTPRYIKILSPFIQERRAFG